MPSSNRTSSTTNDADKPHSGVAVAVAVAAEPAAEAAQQENDQDDDEYRSERHGILPKQAKRIDIHLPRRLKKSTVGPLVPSKEPVSDYFGSSFSAAELMQ